MAPSQSQTRNAAGGWSLEGRPSPSRTPLRQAPQGAAGDRPGGLSVTERRLAGGGGCGARARVCVLRCVCAHLRPPPLPSLCLRRIGAYQRYRSVSERPRQHEASAGQETGPAGGRACVRVRACVRACVLTCAAAVATVAAAAPLLVAMLVVVVVLDTQSELAAVQVLRFWLQI